MNAHRQPWPTEHPIAKSAWTTFDAARTGLEEALTYYGATNNDDPRRLRVALGAIAYACDALKAAANAYSNTLGLVTRAPREGVQSDG